MEELKNPKFKKGEIVRYTKKFVDEVKLNLTKNDPNKEIEWFKLPFGRLLICDEPYWSTTKKEWMYNYEYGHCNISEGSSIESNLEKCAPGFI